MTRRSNIESLEARTLLALFVPDASWGDDGAVRGLYDSTELIGVTGGRIVAGMSFYDEGSGPQITFTRTLPDGTNDPRFRAIEFRGFSIAADLDDQARLITGAPVAGDIYSVQVGRFNASGSRDRTFGTGGVVTFTFRTGYKPLTAYTAVRDVEVAEDGSVLALIEGGSRVYSDRQGERRWIVARFTSAGVLDTAYGQGGLIDLGGRTFTNADGVVPTPELHVDRRGRLYLETDETITRFRINGTRDRAFATNGRFTLGGADFVLDTSGRPVLADGSAGEARVRRLDTAGQLDPTFYAQGQLRLDGGDSTDPRLVSLPGGDLLLQFGSRVVELKPDTQSFGIEGDAAFDVVGKQPDGSLIASGGTVFGTGLLRLTEGPAAQLGGRGTLYIHGADGFNDAVYVRTGADRLRVSVNGKARSFDTARMYNMQVTLGSGENVFTSSADIRVSILTGSGNDTIVTGPGGDDIHTGDGDDRIDAGAGDDRVLGGAGKDTVYAQSGDDTLAGDTGNDYLVGGDGNDRIDAGDGNDQLFGGTPGRPRIADFLNYLFGGAGTDSAELESDNDTAVDIETIV